MAAAVAVAALALPITVDAALERTGLATVKFVAEGNRGIRVVGRTRTLAIADSGRVIALEVPLATVRTGVALRDYHMQHRYLQVERYPYARLEVPWSELKRPTEGATVTALAEGTLRIHGKSRPVQVSYVARSVDDFIRVEGRLRIDIRDFGVEPPAFLGIHLHPVIDIVATFRVTDAR